MTEERTTIIQNPMIGATKPSDEAVGDPCLIVFYGENLGRRHFLPSGESLIGRSQDARVHLDEDAVSRRHASIQTERGRAVLSDLGSTNGTYVNDVKVSTAELRDGDWLKIGRTVFKFLSGSNQEAKYHEEIYRLTTMDGLTQIFNKRYFMESLERELSRARRYKREVSLVMFDIDHFKSINDTYGHLAGDHVLRQLASTLGALLRRDDIFCRYGGEEFAAILPEIGRDGALTVAEKLRASVESTRFEFAEKVIPVTISLGITTYLPEQELVEVDAFIKAADAHLYEAKEGGRNRVCG